MHITKKREIYLFISVLACSNFVVLVTICALFGRLDARGLSVQQLREHNQSTGVSHIAYLLFQIYLVVSWVLLIVGAFALKRRQALEREIGDYDPVTKRTI